MSASAGSNRGNSPADRRRSPRVEILGRVYGHLVSLDVPVIVRDISLHGLSIETTFAFAGGIVHEFRLALGDGSAVMMRGRVVHSREAFAADGSTIFISGVQFVDDDEPSEGETSVGDILDSLK